MNNTIPQLGFDGLLETSRNVHRQHIDKVDQQAWKELQAAYQLRQEAKWNQWYRGHCRWDVVLVRKSS